MKKIRKPIVKDERTERLDGQIASEIVLGVIIFLMVSVLVKLYIFHLSLMAFLPELLLVFAIYVYSIIRRLVAGVDLRDVIGLQTSWFDYLRDAVLLTGVIMVADVLSGDRNLSAMLTVAYGVKLLFTFPFALAVSYVLDKFLGIINRKRQEKLGQGFEAED